MGKVPHSTLGTTPADPWGNRFTYRVVPIYRNDFLGFGQETRADMLVPRLPLSEPDNYAHREATPSRYNSPRSALYGNSQADFYIDNMPVLICVSPAHLTCNLSSVAAAAKSGYYLGALGPAAVAGTDSRLGRTGRREYLPENISSCAVFVIVSHGENGKGGIRHLDGENRITLGKLMKCNSPGSDFENHNTISKLPCAESTIEARSPRYGLYMLRRTHAGTIEFGDELMFMSGSELAGKIVRRGLALGPVWAPPRPPAR